MEEHHPQPSPVVSLHQPIQHHSSTPLIPESVHIQHQWVIATWTRSQITPTLAASIPEETEEACMSISTIPCSTPDDEDKIPT